MRAMAFVFLAIGACVPATSRVVVSAAPPVVETAAVKASPLSCKSPASPGPNNDDDVDAVFFGTCAAFEPVFYESMANACAEALPAISAALRAVKRDELLLPGPRGSESWRPRDRKSFTFFQAARAFVPERCTSDMNVAHYPVDDYGRPIADVSHLWRDVSSCRPDHELFTLRTEDWQRSEHFNQGNVDVGVYMFALAIAPRLTPLGTAYLRKFLLCDELEHEPSDSPWRKRI